MIYKAILLAPGAGFEPATNRLTGDCSTAELSRNDVGYFFEFCRTCIRRPTQTNVSYKSRRFKRFCDNLRISSIFYMYIKIRAKPGSRKEIVTKVSSDHYDISVVEPAENNYANKRILEIMRSLYPKTAVRMISGHHSPSKIISVDID